MKELTAVLATARGSTKERAAARRAFLQRRAAIWADIQAGRFPAAYRDASGRKFVGASRRTAVRCDFLRANKIALGSKYRRDVIADQAQRDFLFYVLRDREAFPHRTGMKFYCCPTCTTKLLECVRARVFRYVDNAKWQAAIEAEPRKARNG